MFPKKGLVLLLLVLLSSPLHLLGYEEEGAEYKTHFDTKRESDVGRMPVVVLIDSKEEQRGFYKTYHKDFVNFTLALTMNKNKHTGEHPLDGTASFGSKLGVGILAAWDFTPLTNLNFFTEYTLDRFSYYPPKELPGFMLIQRQKLASRFRAGVRVFLGPYVFLGAHFGTREDYSFHVRTQTVGTVNKTWHSHVGASIGYHILHHNMITLDGSIGFDYLLPKTAQNFSFGKGVSMNTELRFKLNHSFPLFCFFRFEYYKLEPEFLRKHNAYYYLIGVGVNISTYPTIDEI